MNPDGFFHKWIRLLLLLAAMVSMAACASRNYITEGQRLAAEGNWEQSIQVYQEGLKQHPDDYELVIALQRSKMQASLYHMESGNRLMAQELYAEAIGEFETSVTFYPANQQAGTLLKKAKAKRDALHSLKKGLTLKRAQDYIAARQAFEKAVELDPENEAARRELSKFITKATKPAGKYNLNREFDKPVSFKFKKTSIINVFEVLTKLTGVNFIFDKEMRDNKVTMFMTDVSLDRFIDVLLKTNDLAAVLINKKTMLIYPDTPAKAKEYENLQIRTFYLSNLEAKKAVTLLSKILKSKDIIANENLNSIVVRGTGDVIEIASRLLEANDGTPAEVLFNVEFLEVSRTYLENLGLEYSESATLGIGETNLTTDTDATLVARASMFALSHLKKSEWMLSLPTATLNMIKRNTDTRLLAKPSIRVKNAEKAYIHIGDRVPIRVNRRVDSSTGDVTSDFQYQDVGIKVETKPIINMHNEITLTLNMEVSGLGPNLGTADDPQYTIRTRTAKTVLSLKDSETVVIGGLISDEDRKTIQKVPGLGEVPALGYLFSSLDEDDDDKDILMVITPTVLRSHELPRKEAMQIWSGNAQSFSLDQPFTGDPQNETVYSDEPVAEEIYEVIEMKQDFPTDETNAEQALPPEELLPEELPPEEPPLEQPLPGTGEAPGQNGAEEQPPGMENPLLENPVSREETPPEAIAREAAGDKKGDLRDAGVWPEAARYSIHVNSYQDRTEAEKRIEELKKLGYDCFLIPAQVAGKGFFHRIFVGGFTGYSKAVAKCDQLKNRREFSRDIHVINRSWAVGG
jgi:general secretion pathway protein D